MMEYSMSFHNDSSSPCFIDPCPLSSNVSAWIICLLISTTAHPVGAVTLNLLRMLKHSNSNWITLIMCDFPEPLILVMSNCSCSLLWVRRCFPTMLNNQYYSLLFDIPVLFVTLCRIASSWLTHIASDGLMLYHCPNPFFQLKLRASAVVYIWKLTALYYIPLLSWIPVDVFFSDSA